MVLSTSSVTGSVPGPAPAAHARARSSRLTRSSWRAWPKVKLLRNVPRVDGALSAWPSTVSVPPVHGRVEQSLQLEVLGQGRRKPAPGIGHKMIVIETDVEPVQGVR